MNTRMCWISLLLIGVLLSACGPSEAERQGTVTQVAAAVFATQTALAPTVTPTFTPGPTPTETSTSTPTPLPTNTPTWTPTSVPTLLPARAEAVLHEFMSVMANKEPEKAHTLLSPRAQDSISLVKLQTLLERNNYALFEGYQALKVTTIYGRPTYISNPYPGETATVRASSYYKGNFVGTIDAVFMLDEGEWGLVSFYVTVPPDKF